MKILMVVARDRGGQWIQANKTAEYMAKLGAQVHVAVGTPASLSGYDIVHIFTPDCFSVAKAAKKRGTPLVVSPIFWPKLDYYKQLEYREFLSLIDRQVLRLRHSMLMRLFWDEWSRWSFCRAYRYRGLLGLARRHLDVARFTFSLADLLLPNAEAEMNAIKEYLDINKPYTVVPNAIDTDIFALSPKKVVLPPVLRNLPSKFVASVALISPSKNTLKLIKAAKKLGLPLVLVGAPQRQGFLATRYYERCRKEANKNVYFLGPVPHPDLPAIYSRARVHALVSWCETPGLANLEAAAVGCAVVSTEVGSTREYFGDGVEYCHPADQLSIEKALLRAWEKGPQESLKNRILSRYTWERAAEFTLAAYRELLER